MANTVARHNEFYQGKTLGNELASAFHLSENRLTMATAAEKGALCLSAMGGIVKVLYLEKLYPQLISSPGDHQSNRIIGYDVIFHNWHHDP